MTVTGAWKGPWATSIPSIDRLNRQRTSESDPARDCSGVESAPRLATTCDSNPHESNNRPGLRSSR